MAGQAEVSKLLLTPSNTSRLIMAPAVSWPGHRRFPSAQLDDVTYLTVSVVNHWHYALHDHWVLMTKYRRMCIMASLLVPLHRRFDRLVVFGMKLWQPLGI